MTFDVIFAVNTMWQARAICDLPPSVQLTKTHTEVTTSMWFRQRPVDNRGVGVSFYEKKIKSLIFTKTVYHSPKTTLGK